MSLLRKLKDRVAHKPKPHPPTVPHSCHVVRRDSGHVSSLPCVVPQRLLVGLAGAKRSGKSSVAQALVGNHGFVETSFAEPIRLFAAFLLAPPREPNKLTWLEANKETPIDWLNYSDQPYLTTPREVMQTLGTEWGRRMIHPDLWVRKLLRNIGDGAFRNVVISDVRFENEAKAIRERGGIIVQIARAAADHNDDAHVSEAGLPDDLVDVIFDNNGAIEDLTESVARDLLPVLMTKQGERPC